MSEQTFPASQLPATPKNTSRARRVMRVAVNLVASCIVILFIGAAVLSAVSIRFFVEGPSMVPTLHVGQFLFILRANFLGGQLERGNIVLLHPPGQAADEPPSFKRIIGVPGDTVEFRATRVFVNGTAFSEPYINEPCLPMHCVNQSWVLAANEFFVLGDNRNHSNDSRSFGPVNRDLIMGKAFFRYWPIEALGFI
jgi:signal peptidase I